MMHFIHFKNLIACTVLLSFESYALANTCNTGDLIEYGSYHIESENSYSKIKWHVIYDDDEVCTLLCDYVISRGPYHGSLSNVTWEKSDLRYWLNNSFYKNAFNDEEKSNLAKTLVLAENNFRHGTDGGKDTYDYVYILSASEAADLLTPEQRKAQGTLYSDLKAGLTYRPAYESFWLRTPGLRSIHAMVVGGGNTPPDYIRANGLEVNVDFVGIRPVISLKKK